MSDDNEEMARFVKQGRDIREVLQAVEDALVGAGYDDFVVATERGTPLDPRTAAEWGVARVARPHWGHVKSYGFRGSRTTNSLYSPILLSTAMLPPCCCVTMS